MLLEGTGGETATKVTACVNYLVLLDGMMRSWTCFCADFRADESQAELDEFQQMSRDYEAELETELKQCESRNKELLLDKNRLCIELENLKVGQKRLLIYSLAPGDSVAIVPVNVGRAGHSSITQTRTNLIK